MSGSLKRLIPMRNMGDAVKGIVHVFVFFEVVLYEVTQSSQ